MNNSKERGYIFQDAFSAYIVSNYINRFLNGDNPDVKVVLDKKSNSEDKFDDLKIIENDIMSEIQIKYSESKSTLEWSDLKNASSNYNLYQFINIYNQIGKLYKFHQNLRHVVYQCNDFTLCNNSIIYLNCSGPYQSNRSCIYNHIGHRTH